MTVRWAAFNAVLLGYAWGGEALGARTLAGTLLVLVSVIVITTTPKKKPETSPAVSKRKLADV